MSNIDELVRDIHAVPSTKSKTRQLLTQAIASHNQKIVEMLEKMKKTEKGKAQIKYSDGRIEEMMLNTDRSLAYNAAIDDLITRIKNNEI